MKKVIAILTITSLLAFGTATAVFADGHHHNGPNQQPPPNYYGPNQGPGPGPGSGPNNGPGYYPGPGSGPNYHPGPGPGPGHGPGYYPNPGPGHGPGYHPNPGHGPGYGPGHGPSVGIGINLNYSHHDQNWQLRNDAEYVIHRTAAVLYDAQRAAQFGHNYWGLSQAVAHQDEARRLYYNGRYQDAIYHSLRARDLAFNVIRHNRIPPPPSYYRDEREHHYTPSCPPSNDLDVRIRWTEHTNSSFWSINLNFDL